MYEYRAFVTKVYDGDTITVDIDLGFNTKIIGEKVRLKGLNAPEIRGVERTEGLQSRDWLRNGVLNRDIIVKTEQDKKGKYGRYIGTIYLDGNDINKELVANNHAEFKNY